MLRRANVIWLAAFIALAVVMVVAWTDGFVDERPWCSGVARIDDPHRNTCYGDEIPAGWVLSHPSSVAIVAMIAMGAMILGWLFLRSRVTRT